MKKKVLVKTRPTKRKRSLTNAEMWLVLKSIQQPTGLKDAVKFIHANR